MNLDDFKIKQSNNKDKELVLSDLISNIENRENEEEFIKSFDSNSFQESPEDNFNEDIFQSPTLNSNNYFQQVKDVIDRIQEDQEMEVDYFNSLIEEANK